VDNKEIVIDNTQPRQSVQIFNCKNCTVKVLGKVNAISLDGCVKTGLLFESVVSICEIVNCQSVEVQCCETAPCVAIDKTDGCRLYVGTDLAQSIDVATAKSSEVNIVVLPSEGSVGEDAKEFAVPEQFVTKWRDGRWRTEPVAHSGG
jgi:adenylyl cyclase-associated protein